MEIFVKILLGTTPIYLIHFLYKNFTYNNFDKLFIPKYQKAIYSTFNFILIFIIFVAYGLFFAAMYGKLREYSLIKFIVASFWVIYVIVFLGTITLCLYKRFKDKKSRHNFSLSEKRTNFLLFSISMLNIFMFSISLYELFYIGIDKVTNKSTWIGNLINCTIFYFLMAYLLFKASFYLQGINKREWDYVLSPTPKDITEKHLYVLYSINQSTLVLSDDPNNKYFPMSVYLYDLNKSSFICFNRVVALRKM